MSDADPEARTIAAGLAPGATASDAPRPVLAGRYELLGMLGAGGMGTVYRARDRELDEVVALKVLKKELASSEMIERFRREVKLARRVTHANVARTYDIGEGGGDRFLTMEFIEGEMLASLLARRRRLDLADVVRLGRDLCAGLAAAHAAGVLHRDLKPENVIVARDGRAVITDFGIARAVTEGELSRTVGGVVGTPAYMAPEQVEGSSDLDARADLYALGTMLFELLTGRAAWQGDSVVTVAAGRLLKPPPDVRSVVPTLPADVAELVLKLMARHRADRFSSAAETAASLEAIAVGTAAAFSRPPSTRSLAAGEPRASAPSGRIVAVLPVLNLGASEDRYLVDNVNEDVVDLLSVVPGLLVRPRGETARFLDPTRDVREIGRALGASVVIDGSLRKIGETVRASFRLITVEDGFQLWAKRFDRPPAQVLSIADDAAQAIARALTTELGARARPRTTDAEAEDLYLRGRSLVRRGWHGSQREAADLLTRAADRAPDDPRILGMFALCLARTYGLEFVGRDVADRARRAAARATELDPAQPEAKIALAFVHLHDAEPEAGVGHLRAALAVAPNCVDALDWLGRTCGEVGRLEDALGLLDRALSIDPELAMTRLYAARLRALQGDRSEFDASLREMPEHPADAITWFLIHARDAFWSGDEAKARGLRSRLTGVRLPESGIMMISRLLAIASGEPSAPSDLDAIDLALPIDGSRSARREAFNAQMRTELFSRLGDPERALASLTAADDKGLLDVVWLERCPLLDPLRHHPELGRVTRSATARAERVIAALDARAPRL